MFTVFTDELQNLQGCENVAEEGTMIKKEGMVSWYSSVSATTSSQKRILVGGSWSSAGRNHLLNNEYNEFQKGVSIFNI